MLDIGCWVQVRGVYEFVEFVEFIGPRRSVFGVRSLLL